MKFQNKETIDTLRATISQLSDYKAPNSVVEELRNHVALICQDMASNPDEWDEKCQFNTDGIGESLLSKIKGIRNDSVRECDLKAVFATQFQMLCEYNISTRESLNRIQHEAFCFGLENINWLEEDDLKGRFHYALFGPPIYATKNLLYSEELSNLQSLTSFIKEANDKRGSWEQELSTYEKKAEILKNELKNYETAFNFVGINQGFERLRSQKVREKAYSFWGLIGLGLIVLAPLAFNVYHFSIEFSTQSGFYIQEIFVAAFSLSLVAILTYYFRLVLLNYRSLQSQILQLDLRISLCQFVQSYANYAKEIKSDDSDLLERFEAIIFSNILSDDSKVPAVHDGVEELTKLFKAFKS